jgi:OOP family OmpA-OmpF porin
MSVTEPLHDLLTLFAPRVKTILLVIAHGFFTAAMVGAADLPGGTDYPGIMRYKGAQIIRYEDIKFDRYLIPLGPLRATDEKAKFENSESFEGRIVRITYRVAGSTRSSLEVFRNYVDNLQSASWDVRWKASGKAETGEDFATIYQNLTDNDQLFTYSGEKGHVLVARQPQTNLTAVLFVTSFEMGALRKDVEIDAGDVIVQIDVLEPRAMDQQMVLVKSSEMAQSLASTGRVALYGIQFDFNKVEIKKESDPTLEQIAKLLTEKPALKLLVAGHTDNVGTFDFNRDLSQRRAASVVSALTGRYRVAGDRLLPFGVSYAAPIASNESESGRAKNRRVELVENK